MQPLDLAWEPSQWPPPPTAQSPELPKPKMQGVVHLLCECLGLSKGFSELPQQDDPNLKLLFVKPLPRTF